MAYKYLVSVADAFLYDKCAVGYWEPFVPDSGAGTAVLRLDTALVSARTATDTAIDTTITNVDTRGGFGNPLLNVFYHTAEMTISFTDAKFNLMAIKALVGDSAFAETGASANVITISASYIPKTLEIVMIAKLAGAQSTGCTGIIGNIVIHVPLAQLDGATSLSMTADGVSNTPVKARALASGSTPIYAQIYEFGASTEATVYQVKTLTSTTYIASVYYTRTGSGTELDPYVYTLETGAYSGAKTYYAKYDMSFAARA